jgi:Cu2+-exporting ATPase
LSLPVLYASRGFFTGAVAALRQRTLDMNVLVALAIGVSWVYSVAVTAGLSGEVFYDAGAMLATFVLLGHWFEMRARGSASDAIRTLLDLAPPKAVVLRDGEPVEVPTAEVAVRRGLGARRGGRHARVGLPAYPALVPRDVDLEALLLELLGSKATGWWRCSCRATCDTTQPLYWR